MDIRNPFTLLRDITKKSPTVSAELLNLGTLDKKEKDLIRRVGLSFSQLQTDIQADVNVTWDRQRYTTQLHRSLDHALIAAAIRLYATSACLTGDTEIPLLNGETKTILQIVEDFKVGKEMWVYSCTEEGVPLPAKILNAVKQDHKPRTFRIWLDNGKYVDASDNHRFIKRDGTLCRADELKEGDSLMPFHRKDTVEKWKGYEQIWDVKKKRWVSTYKTVVSHYGDIDLREHNKGKNMFKDGQDFLVVHHIDFNKKNNSPSNLKIMTSKEHRVLHNDAMKERWQDPEWREMMVEKNRESHNTEEYIKARSGENHSNWVLRENRVCANIWCNNEFEVVPNSSKKFCCQKCSFEPGIKVFFTKECECVDCGESFRAVIYPESNREQRFVFGHNGKCKGTP